MAFDGEKERARERGRRRESKGINEMRLSSAAIMAFQPDQGINYKGRWDEKLIGFLRYGVVRAVLSSPTASIAANSFSIPFASKVSRFAPDLYGAN